ncbi:hypothetical protein LTR64_004733 [Lithohypha guttulata]|uniref:uncharacterized protein n=1 Tax=Lithohypha guttulata TaxID=1690604 RepID=UPI002DE18564|nr:hypothetical protein LTR51_005970 [Lithohypha guttulata]
MEESPAADDNIGSSKRKRSPGNLVDIPIPISLPKKLDIANQLVLSHEHPLPKRPRLPSKSPSLAGRQRGINDLPDSVLQHVFLSVDPRSLAHLVRVNQRFRTLLDSRSYLPDISKKQSHDVYATRSQDSIWAYSRRQYFPSMPKPMQSLSEYAQFALVFGTKCQICAEPSSAIGTTTSSSWIVGPESGDIRAVWPFRLRACKDCILRKLRKDAEVLLSDASPLLPGLPFALFDQFMNYIPHTLVRESVPLGLTPQKYYLISDIESFQEELREARSLALAAAEEWLKGLSDKGRASQADAARFENWERAGGLADARRVFAGLNDGLVHRTSSSTFNDLTGRPILSHAPGFRGHPIPSALPPLPIYAAAPGMDPPFKVMQPRSDSISMTSQTSSGSNRASKTHHERARIRAHKRADIIQRCSALNPPITKDMLERLEAFDASLKIAMPLNENSWETLKDRLFHQRRQVVLENEAKNAVRTASTPGIYEPPVRTDEYLLAHADTPRRERLCQIAEEFIKQKWAHGGWVTYPHAPRFAAEVLVRTRQAYIDEQSRIERVQTGNGFMSLTMSSDKSLKLEDMKWVFEQNIKPRTEQIRKELFLCPVCPTTPSIKYFAFESVIQHYASKHTTAFSNGSKVVTWQALWPDFPPFHVHPERIHTPEPSVTHTPNLTCQPLSVVSAGSLLTSTVPSAGWRSPDTMSLVSNTTYTFSVSGQPSKVHNLGSMAPGVGMYELQRDELSSGLLQGWTAFPSTVHVPSSLRLFVAIALAVSTFSKKYSNSPALDLFRDCVDLKPDLKVLKDIEGLRCVECRVQRKSEARANWDLIDLIIHFSKAHENNRASPKVDWKHDMIALPEPAFIKIMQVRGDLPSVLRPLLEEAFRTSTIQDVHTSHPTSGFNVRPERTEEENPSMLYQSRSASHSDDLRNDFERAQPRYIADRPGTASMVAVYDDRSTAFDSASSSSRTVVGDMLFQNNYQQPSSQIHSQTHYIPGRLHSASSHASFQGEDLDMPTAEAMTRTNTVRSYRSRSDCRPADAAEDFLSALDAHVDTEMAESSVVLSQSARTPRPASRSNDVVKPNDITGQRQPSNHVIRPRTTTVVPVPERFVQSFSRAHYPDPVPLHGRVATTTWPRDDARTIAEPIARQRSNVIEFDQYGDPVINSGIVFQQVSSPRGVVTRQYIPIYDQPTTTSPVDGRGHTAELRYRNQEEIRHIDDRVHPRYHYPPVNHIARPGHYLERLYDPYTGRYYVSERPQVQTYAEIEDVNPRGPIYYDEHGRLVNHRDAEVRHSGDEPAYHRYTMDHDAQTHSGR